MDNNSNFNLLNSNNLRGIRSRNSRNIQGNISFSYDANESNVSVAPINEEVRPNQIEIGERTFAYLEALTKVINAMDKAKAKGTKYSMQINFKG